MQIEICIRCIFVYILSWICMHCTYISRCVKKTVRLLWIGDNDSCKHQWTSNSETTNIIFLYRKSAYLDHSLSNIIYQIIFIYSNFPIDLSKFLILSMPLNCVYLICNIFYVQKIVVRIAPSFFNGKISRIILALRVDRY